MPEFFEAPGAAAIPEVFKALCATAMVRAGTHMPEVFETLCAMAMPCDGHG